MIRGNWPLAVLFVLFLLPVAKAQDTTISVGTIIVVKQPIAPFYKVEYVMRRIADPLKAEKKVITPVRDGKRDTAAAAIGADTTQYASTDGTGEWEITKRRSNPANDSLQLEKGARLVFPRTTTLLSKHYADDVNYFYTSADTPRVDTIRIGFWINKQGAVKRVYIRKGSEEKMNKDLYDQIVGAALKIKKWGEPGGYWPRKRFLRKQEFVKDNFYCDMYIIVSSYPMSMEQVKSGSRYMNSDRCRNIIETVPPPKKKKKKAETVVSEKTDGE